MSFRLRIFLGGLAVALLASLFTGLLIRNRTVATIEGAALSSFETDQAIYDELLFLGFFRDGWSDSQGAVDDLSRDHDRRIAVVDFDGAILADSHRGEPLPDVPASVLDLGVGLGFREVPYEVDGSAICAELFADDPEQLAECELFADEYTLIQDPGFSEYTQGIEPVLLYLGFPASALVDQGTFSPMTLAAIAGLVLLVAAIAAAMVAGPMVRPVGELTAAVQHLSDGDLSMRVDGTAGGEIGDLAREYNSMADRLEGSDKSRRQMVSDVAHELRNPVGVLQANLEAAQDGIFPIDGDLVDLLHSETLHMAAVIEDLTQLAQSDAGELSIEPQPIDLSQIADEVVEVSAPGASARRIGFTVVGSPADCLGDPQRLRQVVANLVSNAVRHSPDGSMITITTGANSSRVWLEITDEGTGLTVDEASRVFDRFWRADESRTEATGGSGLGLAICMSLMEAQGGVIKAGSGPGGGRFRIELPPA